MTTTKAKKTKEDGEEADEPAKAVTCPNCGFNLSEHEALVKEHHGEKSEAPQEG